MWGGAGVSPEPEFVTAQGPSAEPPEAAPSLWHWGWLWGVCTAPEGSAGVTSVLWHSSEATAGLCSNQINLGSRVVWFSPFLCISFLLFCVFLNNQYEFQSSN